MAAGGCRIRSGCAAFAWPTEWHLFGFVADNERSFARSRRRYAVHEPGLFARPFRANSPELRRRADDRRSRRTVGGDLSADGRTRSDRCSFRQRFFAPTARDKAHRGWEIGG